MKKCESGFVDGIFSSSLLDYYFNRLSNLQQNEILSTAKKVKKLIECELQARFSKTYSEDIAVELSSNVLSLLGWDVLDKRSTFLPTNKTLKPDLWLDAHLSYCEVVGRNKISTSVTQPFKDHCERVVTKYSYEARSKTAICTDGRSWFITSNKKMYKGEYFFIDFMKRSSLNDYIQFVLLFSKAGFLFSDVHEFNISKLRPINRNTFINDVIRKYKALINAGDEFYWKDIFAYYITFLYLEHNSNFIHPHKVSFLSMTDCLSANRTDECLKILWKHISLTSTRSGPLGELAKSIIKNQIFLGKDELLKLLKVMVIKSSQNYYLGWHELTSDDLSFVYEKALADYRKSDGIYTTPEQLAFEICYETYKLHTTGTRGNKEFLIYDSCCGVGTFLASMLKRITMGPALYSEDILPERRQNYSFKFLGQDKHLLAATLTEANLHVTLNKINWRGDTSTIKISFEVYSGDTTDLSSPIYKNIKKFKSKTDSIALGNPPFVRGHSSFNKNVRGKAASASNENLLFDITAKSIPPKNTKSSLAYVFPTAVVNTPSAKILHNHYSTSKFSLEEVWNLDEKARIFNGCGAQKHSIIFYSNTQNSSSGRVVNIDIKSKDSIKKDIVRCISQASCSYDVENLALDSIPFDNPLYRSKEIDDAFIKLATLQSFKEQLYISVATGAQESWPSVPSSKDDALNKVIKKFKMNIGDPIFVLDKKATKEMYDGSGVPETIYERKKLRPFCKSFSSIDSLELKKSSESIIFMDKSEDCDVTEKVFIEKFPNFHKWLQSYKELLLCDIDRKEGRRKWWMLHRSCDENPTAEKNSGMDFSKTKIIIPQFLNFDALCCIDRHGHVTSNMTATTIAARTSVEKNNSSQLRSDWQYALSSWLNSSLIREYWLVVKGNCKMRGRGEVNVSHILNIPVPNEIFLKSASADLEKIIQKMISVAKSNKSRISQDYYSNVDEYSCDLLRSVSGIHIPEYSRESITLAG